MTQKTFNLLVFPSIKASSFTANQLRRVARECFDLILMLSLNQTSDSNNRRDWLLSFRLTCLVFYSVSGNCYANMDPTSCANSFNYYKHLVPATKKKSTFLFCPFNLHLFANFICFLKSLSNI